MGVFLLGFHIIFNLTKGGGRSKAYQQWGATQKERELCASQVKGFTSNITVQGCGEDHGCLSCPRTHKRGFPR